MRRFLCIAAGLLAMSAHAQLANIDKSASPFTFQAGSVYNDAINPSYLGGSEGYGVSLEANGTLVSTQESVWWQFDYGAAYDRYQLQEEQLDFDESQDFYAYNVRIQSRAFVHEAFTVDVVAEHRKSEQKYGEGISRFQNNVLSIDTLSRNRAEIIAVYGRDPNHNSITAELFWQKDSYDDVNPYASLFDLSQQGALAQVKLMVAGKIGFLARVSITDDDYESNERVDSRLYNALVGIDWTLSGKSSLRVLLGGFQRDAEDGQDRSGFSWDVSYDYSPSDYQAISLTTKRTSAVSEVAFSSSSVDVTHGFNWRYAIDEIWFWQANMSWLEKDINADDLTRTLEQFDAGFTLGYNLRSFSHIMLGVTRRDVSSSDNTVDYAQNEVRLSWLYEF
ncbi:outer membrane beta-barrel protein [Alteromonas facilis]|uniref:outer membrane beta-barrel protein n=1 Tax=Alteromonas facilis TaxID=2048004 RepID=UPI000C290746|nr:outer membrane beta-barrel protein [Alteromonas facilis]